MQKDNFEQHYAYLLQKAKQLDAEESSIKLYGIRICSPDISNVSISDHNGYPHDWEQIRKIILERDDYQCHDYDGYCSGPLQIHHVKELSKGGTNNSDNLVTLCRYHHCLKHEHMQH
jgi:hypothetical protein